MRKGDSYGSRLFLLLPQSHRGRREWKQCRYLRDWSQRNV